MAIRHRAELESGPGEHCSTSELPTRCGKGVGDGEVR